jgi:hypothetical protein
MIHRAKTQDPYVNVVTKRQPDAMNQIACHPFIQFMIPSTLRFTHAKSPHKHSTPIHNIISHPYTNNPYDFIHTHQTCLSPFVQPNSKSLSMKSSPQTRFPQTALLRLKLQPLPPINPPTPLLPTPIQPLLQILTLANIKALQLRAPLHHSLNTDTRNSHTSAH